MYRMEHVQDGWMGRCMAAMQQQLRNLITRSFFLPLDTDGLSSSAGGLGVLTSDFESPLVPQTSVGSHLEEPLDVLSELGFENVGGHLEVLALLVVTLSVEEPSGNAVSFGLGDELGDGVALGFGELTGSELGVDPQDFADEEAEASADSLDFIEGEGDGALSVNVGVEDTVNVLEVVLCVFDDQRHAMDNINLIFYSKYQKQALLAPSSPLLFSPFSSLPPNIPKHIQQLLFYSDMASLRTAFVQTYAAGPSCLGFLTSLSSLLAPNYDERQTPQSVTSCCLPSTVSDGFRKIEQRLAFDKLRSTWIDSFSRPSLVRIADSNSSDFFSVEQTAGSFVHVLELQSPSQTEDLETVVSEDMSLFDVEPTSAASSCQDIQEEDFSQVVDL